MKNKAAILTFKQKQFGGNIFITLLTLKMTIFMSFVLLFSEKRGSLSDYNSVGKDPDLA